MSQRDPDDDLGDDPHGADLDGVLGFDGLEDEQDEIDRADWEGRNHRVTVLVERSWFNNDPDAAIELAEIFDQWILPLARSAAYAFLGDGYRPYVEELMSVAFVVARTAVEKGIDKPLAYVVTSLRNHHRKQMRIARRRFGYEELLGHFEPDGEEPDAFRLVHERDTDREIRALFHEWRQEYVAKKDRYGEMIVDVVELCYLTGETQSEAYDTLRLTKPERKSIAQRLSRMRGNEKSRLYRLAAITRDPDDGWRDGPTGRGGKDR